MLTCSRKENRAIESVLSCCWYRISTHSWIRIVKKIEGFPTYLKLIKSKENFFCSASSDYFGEKGTPSYTHHIKIKERFTLAVTAVQRNCHSLKPKVEKSLSYARPRCNKTCWRTDWLSQLTLEYLIKQWNNKISTFLPRKISFLVNQNW